MRNTIKYNKNKGGKVIVKRIGTLAITGTFVLMSGMLIGKPLVISDETSIETEIAMESKVTIEANDTVIVGSAGATKAINDEEVDLKEIELSNGCEEKEVLVENLEENKIKQQVEEEPEEKKEQNVIKIRCTGYDDVGYTKSGEWAREGVIAGKEEWLHKKCKLYKINKDGSVGELIGEYTFLDTGYGIKTKTANGIEGSIKIGQSVDVWHPSEASIWEWMDKYGDYVYMEGPY